MNDKSCPTTPLYLQRARDARVLRRVLRASCLSWHCSQCRVRRMHCAADRSTTNNFRRPVDVNDPADKDKIYIVVKYHFTPEVAALIRGSTAEAAGRHPLHAAPHSESLRGARFDGSLSAEESGRVDRYFTVDCYFERALAFRPKDGRLYMLYGTYLHRAKRYDQAVAMYAHAEELGLDNPELYYNRGLLEFQRDNLDEAAAYAAKAYAGGYPLPALRDKLVKAGVQIPES